MENDFGLLPHKYHEDHQFCYYMISELEKFLLEDDYIELRAQKLDIKNKPIIGSEEHILDYLLRIGEKELHNNYLKSHILHALLIDIICFLREALSASTKRRLTVTFSLIRKPFVYNLVIILRLFLTEDFLEKFNTEENFDATKLQTQDLKELIELSTATLLTNTITTNDIFDMIFNQNLPESIINLSNQALHPSTTRNRNNLTGIQNINFVFSTLKEIDTQWNFFYSRLKVLLIYFIEVTDFIIFTHLKLDDKFFERRITERIKFYPKV
jgi:hypothetical protein